MKIMTILGTRPEIIRLSRVVSLLDASADHTLVHTGQNYAATLSDVFFRELGVREADVHLGVKANRFGQQIGLILTHIEEVLLERMPERVLILGDTNSALASLIAKRLGIPVFHMEAGNRCYDDRVPEEVNRRIIDHSSSVLLPYTEASRRNLLAEGIEGRRIHVTGNPIFEVLQYHSDRINASDALSRLGLTDREFFLVTMHRAENVDREEMLRSIVQSLERIHGRYGFPVVISTHPRTQARLKAAGLDSQRAGLHFLDPLGFFDFVCLEKSAFCILTDSGTVQEEACILRRPNVTLREVTERPETIACGSNVLAGTEPEDVCRCVELVTGTEPLWEPPQEYTVPDVSASVARVLLGHHCPSPAEAVWLSEVQRRTAHRATSPTGSNE
jgi:UDP-N-acetylglucosamine 2-epimerase (non-hydrolysing)